MSKNADKEKELAKQFKYFKKEYKNTTVGKTVLGNMTMLEYQSNNTVTLTAGNVESTKDDVERGDIYTIWTDYTLRIDNDALTDEFSFVYEVEYTK